MARDEAGPGGDRDETQEGHRGDQGGEGAEATHTYEQVEESKELTLPKLDQVDQVEGGDPDNKGKVEKENPRESSDTEEEEENNQVIQDQVRPGTWGAARKGSVMEGGTGRQDQDKEGAQ